MIGALVLVALLAFGFWIGAASIRQRPRVFPTKTPRAKRQALSKSSPELIEAPTTCTSMPVWTDLDELQLNRLLRDGSPPANPPGAVR